jgi:hypothetical protein
MSSNRTSPLAVDPIKLEMAIERAGDENGGVWSTEDMNVVRRFSGSYTIADVEAVLRDMKRVQTELDRLTK